MRISERKHVLAVLRLDYLKMGQKELADLLKCSRALIQSIELTRTPLSAAMATKVYLATGVSLEWLTINERSRPPVGPHGQPFTEQYFEKWRANLQIPMTPDTVASTPYTLFRAYRLMRFILATLKNKEDELLARYQLVKAIDDWAAGFEGKKRKSFKVNASQDLLEFVERDLKTAKRVQRCLKGKSGSVNSLLRLVELADEVQGNVRE